MNSVEGLRSLLDAVSKGKLSPDLVESLKDPSFEKVGDFTG
jgi:hypothetical protein